MAERACNQKFSMSPQLLTLTRVSLGLIEHGQGDTIVWFDSFETKVKSNNHRGNNKCEVNCHNSGGARLGPPSC
jgi:hypothetical protein